MIFFKFTRKESGGNWKLEKQGAYTWLRLPTKECQHCRKWLNLLFHDTSPNNSL